MWCVVGTTSASSASGSGHHRFTASASRWQVSHTSGCWPVLIWSSTPSTSRLASVRRSRTRRCRAATSRTELVVGVVGGNHQYPSVDSAPGTRRPECLRHNVFGMHRTRVEAVASGRKPAQVHSAGAGRLDPPQFGAASTRRRRRPTGRASGSGFLVAGRKVRHRRRRASATRCRRSSGGAAPRRSTSHPARRGSGA